ncbi:hypothetical protein bcgnr5397_29780 [Bacillus luti]
MCSFNQMSIRFRKVIVSISRGISSSSYLLTMKVLSFRTSTPKIFELIFYVFLFL